MPIAGAKDFAKAITNRPGQRRASALPPTHGPFTQRSVNPGGRTPPRRGGAQAVGLRSSAGVGSPSREQLIWPDQWYDIGMTMAKIAISLPKDQLARVHREVRAGRADSVSGYIASVLAEQEKRDSLRTLLRDLIAQHGEPAPEDMKWAERMLPRRGRG